MDEDRVAFLHREYRAQKHVCGHALQHHSRGLFAAYRIRQLHQPIRVDQPLFGIAAGRPRIGHTIADVHVGDVGSDRLHHARALDARGERELLRVQPSAVIDVNEIEAGGLLSKLYLSTFGLLDLDVFPLEDIGSSGFMDSDGVWHCASLPGHSPSVERLCL